jgi:hypothetical protein
MSWEQVQCSFCHNPMGERAGIFVDSLPWHTECHYAVLKQQLAEAQKAARWWRMAARGYILEEGEVHPDERWPWLET